jgi:hypothetical protein
VRPKRFVGRPVVKHANNLPRLELRPCGDDSPVRLDNDSSGIVSDMLVPRLRKNLDSVARERRVERTIRRVADERPSALSIGVGRRIARDDDLSVRPDRDRPRTILPGRNQVDRRPHNTTRAEGGVQRPIAVQAERDEVDVRASLGNGPSCLTPVTYPAADWGLGIRHRKTSEDDLAIGLQGRSGCYRAEGADREDNASPVAERWIEVAGRR